MRRHSGGTEMGVAKRYAPTADSTQWAICGQGKTLLRPNFPQRDFCTGAAAGPLLKRLTPQFVWHRLFNLHPG